MLFEYHILNRTCKFYYDIFFLSILNLFTLLGNDVNFTYVNSSKS